MWRWIFTSATVLSLMLCIATCALWARSYWKSDVVGLEWLHTDGGSISPMQNSYSHLSLRDIHGCVFFSRDEVTEGNVSTMTTDWPEFRFLYYGTEPPLIVLLPERDTLFHRLGFDRSDLYPDHRLHLAPFWPLALAGAILPGWSLIAAMKRRRRIRAGRCPLCGYNLRGSAERCPECGAAILKK